MSISASWHGEQKAIICYKLVGSWTWDDLWHVVNEMRAQSISASYPVDVIADFTQSDHIPNDALTHLLRLITTRPSNRRFIMLVCPNNIMIRSLVSMAKPLLPQDNNIHLVNSFEEALALIQESHARTG